MSIDVLERNKVAVLGHGEETIVFAHGFGTDQSAWRHVVEAFKDQYRLVLYDTVGGGKTNPEHYSPYRYASLHAYADDLLEICAALDIKDAILAGHSVSGMISLLASVADESRFRKLVMVGASPRYLNDEGYKGGFAPEDLEGLFQAMETNYYAWVSGFASLAMANPERPELAQEFAASLSDIRPDIAQSVSKVIFNSDHRNDLSRLNKEALIIQATDDIAVPMEVGEYLHRHIAGSKLANITATGHFPHISAPEQVIDAMRTFLVQ